MRGPERGPENLAQKWDQKWGHGARRGVAPARPDRSPADRTCRNREPTRQAARAGPVRTPDDRPDCDRLHGRRPGPFSVSRFPAGRAVCGRKIRIRSCCWSVGQAISNRPLRQVDGPARAPGRLQVVHAETKRSRWMIPPPSSRCAPSAIRRCAWALQLVKNGEADAVRERRQ